LPGTALPLKISITVHFPVPLGPIIPIRPPSETVNEIFRNKGATPYFLDNPCALSIGGDVSLFSLVGARQAVPNLASTLSKLCVLCELCGKRLFPRTFATKDTSRLPAAHTQRESRHCCTRLYVRALC